MPNQQTQPQTPLDPQIVMLAQAIRKTESGNNPTAVGKSGEYGAYQFLPSTWAAQSQAAGVNVPLQQASPEQQNEVAYKTLASWKQQHPDWNIGNFASAWNAGEGNPNAYQDNNVGTNAEGVQYNTPAYAQKVAQTYQQIKSQQGRQQYNAVAGGENVQLNAPDLPAPQQPGTTQVQPQLPNVNGYAPPMPPPQQQVPSPNAQTTDPGFLNDITSGNIGGALEDAGNFLAPSVADVYHDIKGDNTKTGLQQVGDALSTALSAATLIPGLGPEALAAKAGLVGGEEGLGILGKIGANAALGGAFGASNALGSGETNPGQIAESGLLGAGTGGALGATGDLIANKIGQYAAKTPESRIMDLVNKSQPLKNALADNTFQSTSPIDTLAQKGLDDTPNAQKLISLLKVADGRINVDALTNEHGTGAIDNLIEDHATDASNLVQNMQGGVPTQQLRDNLLETVAKDPSIQAAGNVAKAQAEIIRRFADYQNSYGDVIPWKSIDTIRRVMNKDYNPETRDVSRAIGDVARKYLYQGGEIPEGMLPAVSLNQSANTPLKTAMANEAELIRARNFVQKLGTRAVKGGRLGKYAAGAVGSAVGGILGRLGGMPGEAAGVLGGGYAGNKVEDLLQQSYFNPLSARAARMLQKPLAKGAANLAKVGLLHSGL